MSALREEIRAILREEIAALGGMAPVATRQVERVRIRSGAEMTRFAQDLIRRAASPEFAERVLRGDLVFDLAADEAIGGPIVSSPAPRPPGTIDKVLVTERDIAALDNEVRSLRLTARSRLTPLARDEARRRGIRIERAER